MAELLKDDKFTFTCEIDIEKAEKPEDKDVTEKPRRIKGLASCAAIDLEGEKVIQSGINFDYFVSKKGIINSDHGKDPGDVVGFGTGAELTAKGLMIEGVILKGTKKADEWWTLLNALEGSGKRAALSIEGKVIRRENNVIRSCLMTACALTMMPVQPLTFVEIVKSLSAEKFCSQPDKEMCTCCGPEPVACDLKKDHDIACQCKEEKALTVGGMGRTLIPQSLETIPKVTTYKSELLTKEETIDFIQKSYGYNLNTAKAIAEVIFTQKGIV